MAQQRALNYAALDAQGNIPDWIPLLPLAQKMQGRDGRFFTVDDPEAIIERTKNQYGMDLPIDLDHNIETGRDGTAYGWITDYKIEEGFIYGKAQWNDNGRARIQNKEYRYISPVFEYEPDAKGSPNGKVSFFVSVALTNRPNLHMPALNNKDSLITPTKVQQGVTMDIKTLAAQLGLDETASDADITTAIEALKQPKETPPKETPPEETPPKETPPKEEGVTQEAYNALLKELAETKVALNAHAITNQLGFIGDALKQGKITPQSADFWKSVAMNVGIEYAKGQLDRMTPIVNTAANSALSGAVATSTQSSLTDDEVTMAKNMGLSIEEYQKAKEAK